MAFRALGRLVLLGFFAFVANSALSQTLYKLIDRNGKVTYSQEAPKDFDGKVIRIDVDPNRNSATLGVPRPGPAAQPPAAAPEAAAKRVAEAGERLAAARKALADAREHPAEDETTFVGKVGGGARSIPTQAYQERLAGLERAVKEAEDELEKAKTGK